MSRLHASLFFLVALGCCLPTGLRAQSFEETWKEFLAEDKVSNISVLARPDRVTDKADYLKYQLMNTNSDFCQSNVPKAEARLADMQTFNPELGKAIPGFSRKLEGLQTKVKAYHAVERAWQRFLQGETVTSESLASIELANRLCEKQTAAKLNYMVAYNHLCAGDYGKAKNIFEKRTLQLAEKTSLQVEDVDGLASRVAKMKAYFQVLPALDAAWDDFLIEEVSPGFERELPVFPCNVVPNVKVSLLRGLAQPCARGREELTKVRAWSANDALPFDRDLEASIADLEARVGALEEEQNGLEQAWAAFLPESKVDPSIAYGYEYCEPESLIRAYVLDGYTFVCGLAESSLQRIDSIRRAHPSRLPKALSAKIKELKSLRQQYDANGTSIEEVWQFFIVNGDSLLVDYESTEDYCDNVQQVKDWTIRGLSGTCEEALSYLGEIEEFNRTFEFKFYEDLECRVQRLRVRIWECRFAVVDELARLEEEQSSYEQRLEELTAEYQLGDRPADCEATIAND